MFFTSTGRLPVDYFFISRLFYKSTISQLSTSLRQPYLFGLTTTIATVIHLENSAYCRLRIESLAVT